MGSEWDGHGWGDGYFRLVRQHLDWETWVRDAQERQRNDVGGAGVEPMGRIAGVYRPPKKEEE